MALGILLKGAKETLFKGQNGRVRKSITISGAAGSEATACLKDGGGTTKDGRVSKAVLRAVLLTLRSLSIPTAGGTVLTGTVLVPIGMQGLTLALGRVVAVLDMTIPGGPKVTIVFVKILDGGVRRIATGGKGSVHKDKDSKGRRRGIAAVLSRTFGLDDGVEVRSGGHCRHDGDGH